MSKVRSALSPRIVTRLVPGVPSDVKRTPVSERNNSGTESLAKFLSSLVSTTEIEELVSNNS